MHSIVPLGGWGFSCVHCLTTVCVSYVMTEGKSPQRYEMRLKGKCKCKILLSKAFAVEMVNKR